MEKDILKVLISEEGLNAKVTELGKRITDDYSGRSPIFIGVLKGCFVFMADLMRHVDLYCDVEFMSVSSYGGGTKTTGAVKINKDLGHDIEGRDVILIEDILDSGVTLSYLRSYLKRRNPASIQRVTLMDNPARRMADITADYYGFNVPDEFVVGYGLDYAERYRNLPYIGILKPEVYS